MELFKEFDSCGNLINFFNWNGGNILLEAITMAKKQNNCN